MNFGQMSNNVVANLGLQDIDSYDETSMVAMWLNQAVLDLLSRTRLVVRCVNMTTQNGVDTYTLDHKILSIVDSDNALPPGRRYRAARNENTAVDPAFRLIRSDVLQIVPTPSEDGQTVQIWAVLQPQPMANPNDDPQLEQFGAIPPEFHDVLITYALWKCADYADDGSSQSGDRYRILYEGADGRGGRLAQIRMLVNKRGTGIPVRRRVRLPGMSYSGYYAGG